VTVHLLHYLVGASARKLVWTEYSRRQGKVDAVEC